MAELSLGNSRENTVLKGIAEDTTQIHEVNEEFSLPDYTPEVRKVLVTRGVALPESRYISSTQGGENIEINGIVTYSLIYTDDEGNLCALPLSSNYEIKRMLPSNTENVFVDTTVENVACRVSAPRKLSIKARLKTRIIALSKKEISESISPKTTLDEMYLERQSEEYKSLGVREIEMKNIKISDKFETQGIKKLQPIWCDARGSVSEIKCSKDFVSVRGEATIKCLVNTENGIQALTRVAPITEEVNIEGVEQGDMARCHIRCVSLAISNEESTAEPQLFFDLTMEIEGEVDRNSEISVTKDCYSTKHETENTYKQIDIYTAKGVQNTSFSVNESLKRKGTEINKILDVICDPVFEKTEIKSGRLHLFGKLAISIIGETGAEENEYLAESYELPFRYETDISTQGDATVRCNIAMKDIKTRLDEEKIYINVELCPTITAYERKSAEVLDSSTIKKEQEIKNDLSCVRVYFPKEGDTLWEIAKKYHTTTKKIMEQNDLADNGKITAKNLII